MPSPATGRCAARTPPPLRALEFDNDNYADSDTAEVILALRRTATDSKDAIRRGLRWLEGMQCKDGGWGAFDADNTRELVNKLPFCDFGAVIDPPSADVTAHIVEAFAAEGLANESACKRGVIWLLKHQEEDGSWFGRWGATTSTAPARWSPRRPVTGQPGRQDTVEHVHAEGCTLHQGHGISHPHQVAGPVQGEHVDRGRQGRQHLRRWLTYRQASDGVPVELALDGPSRTFESKVGRRTSLHDPEQALVRPPVRFPGPMRPSDGSLRRGADELVRRREGAADIQRHLDVRPEAFLYLDRVLRRQPVARPVVCRAEVHPAVVHVRAEGEDLVPPRVGQDVTVPCGEAMESPEPGDGLEPRTHHQVVRVGQDHLGRQPIEVRGVQELYRAAVPTGMKHGVANEPRAVVAYPARAIPSVGLHGQNTGLMPATRSSRRRRTETGSPLPARSDRCPSNGSRQRLRA